ncbi:hypothetical protein C8R45DRAFT_1113792 [Mycena sanguinolenta]|nr:hypothetical protein C8R45DRAFT_1113792 [Mycena sanguinolenta]
MERIKKTRPLSSSWRPLHPSAHPPRRPSRSPTPHIPSPPHSPTTAHSETADDGDGVSIHRSAASLPLPLPPPGESRAGEGGCVRTCPSADDACVEGAEDEDDGGGVLRVYVLPPWPWPEGVDVDGAGIAVGTLDLDVDDFVADDLDVVVDSTASWAFGVVGVFDVGVVGAGTPFAVGGDGDENEAADGTGLRHVAVAVEGETKKEGGETHLLSFSLSFSTLSLSRSVPTPAPPTLAALVFRGLCAGLSPIGAANVVPDGLVPLVDAGGDRGDVLVVRALDAAVDADSGEVERRAILEAVPAPADTKDPVERDVDSLDLEETTSTSTRTATWTARYPTPSRLSTKRKPRAKYTNGVLRGHDGGGLARTRA